MAITIVQTVPMYADGGNAAGTTDALAVDDFLVLARGTDDDGDANWLTPTGSAGATGWTQRASIGQGTNTSANIWTCPVTTSGAKTVTSNFDASSGDNGNVLYVLRGVNVDNPLDAAAVTAAQDNTTSLALPSMSVATAGALMIAVWACRDPGGFTLPGTMTQVGAWDQSGCGTTGYEFRAGTGAIGTRSASGPEESMSACGILLRPAAGGGPGPSAVTNRFFHVLAGN
jgi:hypothetical protein